MSRGLAATLLTAVTIVGASVALGIAAFLFAYPEAGAKGWLLVAAIAIVSVIASSFLFRAWKKS